MDLIRGQYQQWIIQHELGKGYSGEALLVKNDNDSREGVVKRPKQRDIQVEKVRQAIQIEREGKILSAIKNISFQGSEFQVRAIKLLDQSLPGSEQSAEYFIVQEKASGYSLIELASINKHGLNAISERNNLSDQDYLALSGIAKNNSFFHLIVLRALYGILKFLEIIHKTRFSDGGNTFFGIIWSDIKP